MKLLILALSHVSLPPSSDHYTLSSFTRWEFLGGNVSDVEVSPDGSKVFVLGNAGSWISLMRSRDGGLTFDPLVWLPNSPNGLNLPAMALSPSGRLHVIRAREEQTGGPETWGVLIYHTYSDDNGDTWSAPRDIVSGLPWLPRQPLAVGDSDPGPGVSPVLHILYYDRRPYYIRSLDDGTTFEKPVNLRAFDSSPFMREGAGSIFASDLNLYIVGSLGGNLGGFYSPDGGNTFRGFKLGRAGRQQPYEFTPAAAFSPSGDLAIFYGTCGDTNSFLQFRPTTHRLATHKFRPPSQALFRGLIRTSTPPTVFSTGLEMSLVLDDINDSPIYSRAETVAPSGCKQRGTSIKCRSKKVRFAIQSCGGSDYRYTLRLRDFPFADDGSVGIIDLGLTLDGVTYQEFKRIRPLGQQAETLWRENPRCLFR